LTTQDGQAVHTSSYCFNAFHAYDPYALSPSMVILVPLYSAYAAAQDTTRRLDSLFRLDDFLLPILARIPMQSARWTAILAPRLQRAFQARTTLTEK
jgi:hypothetical protein